MSAIITRLFYSHEQALHAVAALREEGFGESRIFLTGPGLTEEEAAASIARGGVSDRAARAYAARIGPEGAVLTVRPVYGHSAAAIRTLRPYATMDLGVPDEFPSTIDPAAPLSSYLGFRVLSRNRLPFSDSIGLSALSRRQNPRVRLLRTPAPLSRIFKIPLLSRNPAPLSQAAKTPLLLAEPAPLSTKIGLRVLTRGPAFLGKIFGPLLLRHPAPFSAMLSMPTLSRNPAPLSRLFGWKVLARERR